jgi:hypothetical protein
MDEEVRSGSSEFCGARDGAGVRVEAGDSVPESRELDGMSPGSAADVEQAAEPRERELSRDKFRLAAGLSRVNRIEESGEPSLRIMERGLHEQANRIHSVLVENRSTISCAR